MLFEPVPYPPGLFDGPFHYQIGVGPYHSANGWTWIDVGEDAATRENAQNFRKQMGAQSAYPRTFIMEDTEIGPEVSWYCCVTGIDGGGHSIGANTPEEARRFWRQHADNAKVREMWIERRIVGQPGFEIKVWCDANSCALYRRPPAPK